MKPGDDSNQLTSSISALKPQKKNYMKNLNRVVKKKEDSRSKKITIIDKYRKQELPENQRERKAASNFMKGSNAEKCQ